MIKLGLLKCPERIVHMNWDEICFLIGSRTAATLTLTRSEDSPFRLDTLGRLCFIIHHFSSNGAHDGIYIIVWRTGSLLQLCIASLCAFNLSVSACVRHSRMGLLWAQNQAYWCYTGTDLHLCLLLCLSRCKSTIVLEFTNRALIWAAQRCHLLKATNHSITCVTTDAHSSIGWLYNSLFKSNLAVLARGPSRIDTRKINLWIFGERQRTAAT